MIARGPARASRSLVDALVHTLQERPTQELNAIWNGVREDLRGTLPPSAFHHWLEPLRAVGVQGTRLYVSGPERVRDWFQRRYGPAATEALRRRAPEFTEIAFTDAPDAATTGGPPGRHRARSPPACAAGSTSTAS